MNSTTEMTKLPPIQQSFPHSSDLRKQAEPHRLHDLRPLAGMLDSDNPKAKLPGEHLKEDDEVQPLTIWAPSQFLAYTPDISANLLGDGILQKGEWTSLLGVGGLGKSRLALALCIAQLTGRDWCGLKTGGLPEPILFLSTENGRQRWKTDLERMMAGLIDHEKATVEKNLRALAMTPEEDGDLNMGNEESRIRLGKTLKLFAPAIVVLDPFADMVDGDENKTQDIVNTLRALKGVLQKNAPSAAILIIHHARTGASNVAQAGDNYSAGNFGRGSKALYSRVRAEIQLAPADRDDSNRLVLACGKSNNGPKFLPRGIVFDPETFDYSVDTQFDVEAWRNDVSGQRGTGKTCTVADVVEAVREKYSPGEEVTTGYVTEKVKEWTFAGAKTVQRRLVEARKAGYLRAGNKRGTWCLGAKALK